MNKKSKEEEIRDSIKLVKRYYLKCDFCEDTINEFSSYELALKAREEHRQKHLMEREEEWTF